MKHIVIQIKEASKQQNSLTSWLRTLVIWQLESVWPSSPTALKSHSLCSYMLETVLDYVGWVSKWKKKPKEKFYVLGICSYKVPLNLHSEVNINIILKEN